MEGSSETPANRLATRIGTFVGSVITVAGAVGLFWVIYIKNYWSDPGIRAGYFGAAFAVTVMFVFFGGVILDLSEWLMESIAARITQRNRKSADQP